VEQSRRGRGDPARRTPPSRAWPPPRGGRRLRSGPPRRSPPRLAARPLIRTPHRPATTMHRHHRHHRSPGPGTRPSCRHRRAFSPSSRFVQPPLRRTAGAGLRTRPRDDPPRNLLAPAEATTPPPSSSSASITHLQSNSRQADGSRHAQHDDRTAPRPPPSPVGGKGGGVRDAPPSTLGWRRRDVSPSTSSPPA
jgi:hypothetical protein